MNFTTHTDHANHQLIIRYEHLVRFLDYKYQNQDNIMILVNEMRAEIRDEKLNILLNLI